MSCGLEIIALYRWAVITQAASRRLMAGSITNGPNRIIASFRGAGRSPANASRRTLDAFAIPAIVKVKVHKPGGWVIAMTVVVRSKDELVVPRSVRRQAGIKSGDRVRFKVSGGIINIIPELAAADERMHASPAPCD